MRAISAIRSRAPGRNSSSLSSRTIHAPLAAITPVLRAGHTPWFVACRSRWMRRSRILSIISAERSVEPSSVTNTSKSRNSCVRQLSTARRISFSRLKIGITMLKIGSSWHI